ncbi:MAG: transporter substrate-binding domain-containing protein [Defluviicoccus sp.]
MLARVVFALAAVASAAGLPASARCQPAGDDAHVVTVRSDMYCPYVCAAESDQPGYVIELTRAAFAAFGYRVDYEVIPYARAIEATRRGEFDAVAAVAVEDTPGFVFSNAVGWSPTVLATRKGSGFVWRGPESLAPLRLGAVIGIESWGSEVSGYIAANRDNPDRIDFSGGDDPYVMNVRKLLAGRVDVIADGELVLKHTLARLNATDAVEVHLVPSEVQPLLMGFSPANERSQTLVRMFNDGLARIRSSGELARILVRYGIADWEP